MNRVHRFVKLLKKASIIFLNINFFVNIFSSLEFSEIGSFENVFPKEIWMIFH